MPIKTKGKIMIADHVLEVRHAAWGSFLDVRGYFADYIRSEGIFPHWKIESNVVTFRDMADSIKKDGAFLSYKNAGYVVFNPDTKNYFVDKASSFWTALLKIKHYKLPELTRFGARTRIFLPSDKSFEEIKKLAFEVFYTEKARNFVEGKETDLQFIIEHVEGQFDVRLSGGPMHKNEVAKHLSFDSEEFEHSGLFLDLDYNKKSNLKPEVIPQLLREVGNLSWAKIENIASALEL